MSHRAFVALPGAEAAAARAASLLDARLLLLHTRRFPDGERYLRLEGEVAGATVAVVAHLSPPDELLLALVFLADTLRDLRAARIELVLPYLPYMRQDARFQPGEAVTSRSLARLLSGSADALVTVDPHLHRWRSLDALFRLQTRVVPAAGAIAAWVRDHVPRPLIVTPDEEGAQWAAAVAGRVGAPWRTFGKQRRGDREVRLVPPVLDDVADRTPVLVDDIVSSGHTLAQAVHALRAAGLPAARCVAVHGVWAPAARELLKQAGAAAVVTSNTLPGEGAEIDIWPDIVQAIASLDAAR